MDESESLVPLKVRLDALEALVKGVPASYDENAPTVTSPSQSVMTRMQNTREVLERLGQESEGIKRLLNGYEGYKQLLLLPEDEVKNDSTDLIPDQVKVSILLESKFDLIFAERDLREIEVLKHRGVDGSGDLERLLELGPELDVRIDKSDTRRREIASVRKEVVSLLKRYSEFTSTVSDMFLELHHQLEDLEDQVQKAERAKRKELKERY